MAQSHGLTEGRRMRVDTTVVETNIHHPTEFKLLGDGVRVLIRTMKKITRIVGEAGTRLRDRSRSVKLRVLDIARAARSKAKQGQEKLSAPTVNCSIPPVGWQGRPNASRRKSPRA